MLFYISVIYDTCVSEKELFKFGKYGTHSDTYDIGIIKNGGMKFNQLFAHILAEKYYPLFNKEVEAFIHDGLSNLGISFDKAVYNYTKKELYDECGDL